MHIQVFSYTGEIFPFSNPFYMCPIYRGVESEMKSEIRSAAAKNVDPPCSNIYQGAF